MWLWVLPLKRKVYKPLSIQYITMKQTITQENLLEVRGILRTLGDISGQSIATPERLKELNNFLKGLGEAIGELQ